jgi:hypothetical protein
MAEEGALPGWPRQLECGAAGGDGRGRGCVDRGGRRRGQVHDQHGSHLVSA